MHNLITCWVCTIIWTCRRYYRSWWKEDKKKFYSKYTRNFVSWKKNCDCSRWMWNQNSIETGNEIELCAPSYRILVTHHQQSSQAIHTKVTVMVPNCKQILTGRLRLSTTDYLHIFKRSLQSRAGCTANDCHTKMFRVKMNGLSWALGKTLITLTLFPLTFGHDWHVFDGIDEHTTPTLVQNQSAGHSRLGVWRRLSVQHTHAYHYLNVYWLRNN